MKKMKNLRLAVLFQKSLNFVVPTFGQWSPYRPYLDPPVLCASFLSYSLF